MSKLGEIILSNILNVLMKDEGFANSLAESIKQILDVSWPAARKLDPFQDVVERIVKHCEDRSPNDSPDIPGLRNNLISMMREQQFLAFTRILRMLQDLFEYPDSRVINYLKKLRFQTKFREDSASPWNDIAETSRAIRVELDPKKMDILGTWSYERKCLLRGFTPEELNLISNFSPKGLNLLSRIGRLPRSQREKILDLRNEESKLIEDFGYNRIRYLANLGTDERNELLDSSSERELFRDAGLLGSLSEDAIGLAGRVRDLSEVERSRYSNLGRTQLETMKNFNEEQRNVIMAFKAEDLATADSLDSRQRNIVLSLTQEEIQILLDSAKSGLLRQIQTMNNFDPELIKRSSDLGPGEEEAILELNSNQKLVLLKSYGLGRDGIFMIQKLGFDLTRQVFDSNDKQLNVRQKALTNKLQTAKVHLDRTELTGLFEVINHRAGSVLLNLSWRGRELLSRLAHLDETTINFVKSVSTSGTEVLTRNDHFVNPMILEGFQDMDVEEVKVLINLDVYQREDFSEGDLSRIGRVICKRMIPLSRGERSQLENKERIVRMSPKELNLFSSLTAVEVDLLSSFLIWHSEEDLVFDLLMGSREEIRSILQTLPDHDYNLSKLLATTVESLRLTGMITDEFIGDLESSMIFKVQLLNLSMRDSRSLESVLIPRIEDFDFDGEIHTMDDVMFVRWILSRPPDKFTKFARASLARLTGREVDILLFEPTQQVMNNFRRILIDEDYLLATSFFLADWRNSELIGSTLTPNDCFQLLETLVDGYVLDPRFPNPNVLEVSLYYNRGNPIPLLELLEKDQLWQLFRKRSFLLLQLIARNCRTELFRLYEKIPKLNDLIEGNRISIYKSLIEELKSYTGYHTIEIYTNFCRTIRCLAYSGSFVGKERYMAMVSEYVGYLQGHVSRGTIKIIVDSFVSEDVDRTNLIRSLKDRLGSELLAYLENDLGRSCGYSRQRRDIYTCLDSEDAKEIENEEEQARIEKTIDRKEFNSKLYQELLEYSEYKFQGLDVDPGFERDLMFKIKYLRLETIDPRIVDIVTRMKSNSVDDLLIQSGTAERIKKVASGAGLGFTVFLVGKHLVHGDLKDLGYDALNLWIMPKIGEQITDKLTDLAGRYNFALAKGLAPVIGAVVGNLAAFVGLLESVRSNPKDPVDLKLADLNIISNSIFIVANVPAVIQRIASNVGAEISVIGELAGPFGLALSVGVVVASHFISLGFQVEKFTDFMELTNREKVSLYWSLLWDRPGPGKLRLDVTVKEWYIRYLNNYLHRFKGEYDRIAISLPDFFLTNSSSGIDFSEGFAVNLFPSGDVVHASRVIPHNLEGYDLACGPTAMDAVEKIIDGMKKWFIPSRVEDECKNIVSFRRQGFANSTRILLDIAHDASIVLSKTDSLDMMFSGTKLSITDRDDGRGRELPRNRFYFAKRLANCSVHKTGENYFYLKGKEFECVLGWNQQRNTVVVKNDFIDSVNIHTILGSEKRETIEANYAEYVDGGGGGDVIAATERTIVKGYFNDFIMGKCVVLLPMNVSEINKLFVLTRMSIHNVDGSSLSVDGNTGLMTADRYLLTPIRSSNVTHRITHGYIKKTLDTGIVVDRELATMRGIKMLNCTLVKHLSSKNYDIVLSDVGQNIFLMDKNYHQFYWESSDGRSNFYMFGKLFGNVTISKGDGILDFQDLKIEFDPEEHLLRWDAEGGIEICISGLRVIVLPNYKKIVTTFDGKNYFNLENRDMIRNYCSHEFRVRGRVTVDGRDLPAHFNCFKFDENKILFLRMKDNLILASGKDSLTIWKYYSVLHAEMRLSLKLKGWIVDPETFQDRATRPYKLIYYTATGLVRLKIYHNQPVDKHLIGFVDLTDKSIKDFTTFVENRDLLMTWENATVVRIKNWETCQPGRELMFAFNDSFLPNGGCIISNCEPGDIVEEFQIKRTPRIKRQSPESMTNLDLGFFLLQDFLRRKYPLPKVVEGRPGEDIAAAVGLVQEFEGILKETAERFDIAGEVDCFQLYRDVLELVRRGDYRGIRRLMTSAVEEIYPRDGEFSREMKNWVGIRFQF